MVSYLVLSGAYPIGNVTELSRPDRLNKSGIILYYGLWFESSYSVFSLFSLTRSPMTGLVFS